jgi:type I restriction enzyme S subunit
VKDEVLQNRMDEVCPESEIPEGWAAATLGDIGDLYCGQSPAINFVNTTGAGTPYITGPEQWDGNELHVDKWTTDPRRSVPDRCIFVTVKGAGVGTIFPGLRGAIGRDIYAFKPATGIDDSFVRRALEFTVSEIKRNAAGDIPGLSKDHLLKHRVNVPPCEEQKRVVKAIDDLFVLAKSTRSHLSRVQAILKHFRQAVLAAACSGKLTQDRGLSVSWEEVQLGDLALEIRTGPFGSALHKSDYVRGGIPVINPTNIVAGKIVPSARASISKQTFFRLREYALEEGDIVIGRRGEMGRCAVVRSSETGWLCGTGSALVRLKDRAVPDFIQLCISSPEGRAYLSEGSVGSTMENLNQKVFAKMPLPLPPREEQSEIVRRVKSLFALAENVENNLAASTVRVDALTQSILAKAFRGELIPTEAELARREGREYEPASVLLERIRADKAHNATTPPASKRKLLKATAYVGA